MEFCNRIKSGLNEIDLFTYHAVDIKGNYINIELANFIVIDLGTDRDGKYANFRDVLVKEKQSGVTRSFRFNTQGENFLKLSLMPLINELNHASSFMTLSVYEELDKLRSDYENLKGENVQLKLHVDKLETEIKNRK